MKIEGNHEQTQQAQWTILHASDYDEELSVHSSDDELDQYILASPEAIARTSTLSQIQQAQRRLAEKEEKLSGSLPKEPDALCTHVIKKAYLALGLDLIGPDMRKLIVAQDRHARTRVLGKRPLARIDQSLLRGSLVKTNQKTKKVKSSQISGEDLVVSRVEVSNKKSKSPWIEQILDELTEMNKGLFKRLRKELVLASRSSQTLFCRTLHMLLCEFRANYCDHSLDLHQNLLVFLEFVGCFFRKSLFGRDSLQHANSLDFE